MNESIIVSTNGDTITITTEPRWGGLLLPKDGLLQMLSLFIGERDVFYKRATPEPLGHRGQDASPIFWIDNSRPLPLVKDWVQEMARHLGVRMRDMDSPECWECGRLVGEPGLCGSCADEKAGVGKQQEQTNQ